MINFEDFAKLEIKVGTIVSVEKVEDADKLLKLDVDFGDEKRQIVSGIAQWYKVEDLEGKQFPFLVNLEPRIFRGIESQGMILAIEVEGKAVLMEPLEKVPDGSKIR